jgi:hypothetical protein
MTPLDKVIKRALRIKDQDFVVTLTPLSLKLTRKGHKNGVELVWESLVSGEMALAVALQASVGRFPSPGTENQPGKKTVKSSKRVKRQRAS